jgi:hypothetical protein
MRLWAAFRRMMSPMLGCGHPRTTFPVSSDGRTYIVCLDCGREFDYSWKEMRIR